MRKKAVMIPILLIFLLFIITSCGKQPNSSDKLDNDHVNSPQKEAAEVTSKEKKDSEKNEKLQGSTSTNQAIGEGNLSKNAGVIAKSDNNLTDSERQAIVEDLTNEIDRLINDVNNLEDL